MAVKSELIKDKTVLYNELNNLNCKLEDLERIKMIIDFLDEDPVVEIIDQLNSKFNKIKGNKAIPRQIIIGTMMYCFNDYIDKFSDLSLRTRTD